ncbi:MAG: hypothetical protein CM1200mP25_3530 [Acidobacteriota bacterium]|nr:MAG: hypothetical protein CM1200mP25_3530 [Acidobacteriota bacterium]
MISNNSSGARSVLYGKTIDHVLDLHVASPTGLIVHFKPLKRRNLMRCATIFHLKQHAIERFGNLLLGQKKKSLNDIQIFSASGGFNLDCFVDKTNRSTYLNSLSVLKERSA